MYVESEDDHWDIIPEPTEEEEAEEEYGGEDYKSKEDKENIFLEPKRGASRGSKYSKAKTLLTRGVKSIITDKGWINLFFISIFFV